MRWVFAGLLAFSAAAVSAEQSTFEVASVKESNLPGGGWKFSLSGGVDILSVPLHTIITIAHGVDLRLERVKFDYSRVSADVIKKSFEIRARGGDGDKLTMLRTLLAERFGLRTHTETRQVNVYAVVVARPGKLGQGLRPAAESCDEFRSRGGKKDDPDAPPCWASHGSRNGVPISRGAGTMDGFILEVAQPALDLPVVNMTGLEGPFRWELTIDRRNGQDIFDAFEDQLGLKIEHRVGSWEVIVIDDVKMPTPN